MRMHDRSNTGEARTGTAIPVNQQALEERSEPLNRCECKQQAPIMLVCAAGSPVWQPAAAGPGCFAYRDSRWHDELQNPIAAHLAHLSLDADCCSAETPRLT